MKQVSKEPELLINDAHGIYIPQLFCQNYAAYITNMDQVKEDFNICLHGPDNEEYWDAWDRMLNNVEFTNDNNEKFSIGYLPDLSDLWAIPEGYEFEDES